MLSKDDEQIAQYRRWVRQFYKGGANNSSTWNAAQGNENMSEATDLSQANS
ncbi:MAG: hypothetical protein MUC60_09880 [Oscillatoria sp. Prado101]|nr:hypothetical protein [Oscillatoria sp. Prado101]